MALVNFKKGTQSDYDGAVASYANYIYVAEDTRNVYLFGVLQQGISDEDFAKLDSFDSSVLETINDQKNIANGIAGLDEDGKIPVSLLNGQQARVQGVDKVATSSTLPETTSLAAEYMVWCTDDKKLREWSGAEWDVINPVGDTIYNFRNSDATGSELRKNILYRWDGSDMVEISASIALGETSGTAYEGSKGAENRAALNSMMNTVVTGFGAVTPNATQISIAFNDADKTAGTNVYATGDGGTVIIPAATSSTAGLLSAADKAALDAIIGAGGGSGESLPEIAQDITEIKGDLGNTDNLTTDSKEVVGAINEIDAALDALNAAAVKQVKVGSNEALNPSVGLITIANATTSADGSMSKEDKAKLDKVLDNGDGSQFLANDGTYKAVPMNLSAGYTIAENVNLETEPAAGDSFETAISKLHKAASDNKEAVETSNTNFQTVLGVNGPNMTMPDLSDTNYLNGQTQFVAALKALDTALKTVADQAAQITDLTSRVVALENALTLQTVGA